MKHLVLLLLLPLAIAKNYELTKVDQSPGLYYDYAGKIRFYDSTWKVIAHTDLKLIRSQIDIAKRGYTRLNSSCQWISITEIKNTCVKGLEDISQRLKIADNQLTELPYLVENTKRTKRSFWSSAGEFFDGLFNGFSRKDNSAQYQQLINNLDHRQDKSESLLKMHTTLIEENTKKINEVKDEVTKLDATLRNYTYALYAFKKETAQKINQVKIDAIIQNYFNLLLHFMTKVETNVKDVTNSIMFGKSNKLHPSVMTIDELHSELITVRISLPSKTDLILPLNRKNIYKIVELSAIHVYHTEDMLIFEIILPLVEPTVFNVYDLVPLPIESSEGYVSINPASKFLAMSQAKVEYTSMKSLERCLPLFDDEKICIRTDPIYMRHYRPTCEVSLLVSNKIDETCTIQKTPVRLEVWEKLHTVNNWLYVTTNPVTMTINCGDSAEDIEIKNTGILQLSSECKAHSERTYLIAGKLENFTKSMAVIPKVNILDDACCNTFINATLNDKIMHTLESKISLKELYTISSEIVKLTKKVENIEIAHSAFPADSQPFGLIWVILITVASVLIVVGLIHVAVWQVKKIAPDGTNIIQRVFNK